MKYELLLMIKEALTEEKAKEVFLSVKTFIASLGGKVELEDFWGKRKLAYKIAKSTDAYYALLNFTLDPKEIKKLNTKLKLENDMLRYLLVKKV